MYTALLGKINCCYLVFFSTLKPNLHIFQKETQTLCLKVVSICCLALLDKCIYLT